MVKKKSKENKVRYRINEQIRAKEVRITGDVERSGDVIPYREAIRIADDLELDLVEISPNANPPVCKIIDYKKFLYDLKRKKKDAEKRQKETKQDIKELRFGPNTDVHDYQFKLKHARTFLENNDVVKAFVFFKGREITFKEKGEILLLKLANDLEDIGTPDSAILKLEGKRMIMFIRPKKKK